MSDKYVALTVVLNRETKGDDCRQIMDAIKMIKGVQQVNAIVSNPSYWAAKIQVESEMKEKIVHALCGGMGSAASNQP